MYCVYHTWLGMLVNEKTFCWSPTYHKHTYAFIRPHWYKKRESILKLIWLMLHVHLYILHLTYHIIYFISLISHMTWHIIYLTNLHDIYTNVMLSKLSRSAIHNVYFYQLSRCMIHIYFDQAISHECTDLLFCPWYLAHMYRYCYIQTNNITDTYFSFFVLAILITFAYLLCVQAILVTCIYFRFKLSRSMILMYYV